MNTRFAPKKDQTDETDKMQRFIGIDIGAETLKIAEIIIEGPTIRLGRMRMLEHDKNPAGKLPDILKDLDWDSLAGAAACGRLGRQLSLAKVPLKRTQSLGFRMLYPGKNAALVSIGSHGFSILELRENGTEVFRENSRCSQGTGNFLRQLVGRFHLGIEAASELCTPVTDSSPLSSRCPVILKTDMTHLANKGEDRAKILAGLFDAVCENVFTLVKPGSSPSDLLLIGGVSQSRRIRDVFGKLLNQHGMRLLPWKQEEALYLEAIGCALAAAEEKHPVPPLEQLLIPETENDLEKLPPLKDSLGRVHRQEPLPVAPRIQTNNPLIIGFDIGSTGSKAVVLDSDTRQTLWEGYLRTAGNPVSAAQELVRRFWREFPSRSDVIAVGVTGSGREIVGSLMNTCFGAEQVYVLNEIAAHAAGATHFDPRVDTIFEIGGQDAKYIRLSGGRVIDCAMNEACSAGTGSFIEEQGQKFSGLGDVTEMSRAAMEAPFGVSLGQHCSVFMAEIIDEAVAAGTPSPSIIAGLYDSIIQNYLNRVKGNRSVGEVIFCQGMPFRSDALASAVARQTGKTVIIPPNPGTVGALGIALLALRELNLPKEEGLDLERFLSAGIEEKSAFVCKSATGCGGTGNHCRIDYIRTVVDGERQRFNWGGGCSLYDKGTRKRKLPNLAPDPFRERENLTKALIERLESSNQNKSNSDRTGKSIALSDEFMLKGLFPYFATLLNEMGFDLKVAAAGDHETLRRGVQKANVPFCAPMQLFHGVASQMKDSGADFLFLPMVRQLPHVGTEKHSVTCPIVQACPDLLKKDLGASFEKRLLSPVINGGKSGLTSEEFLLSSRGIAQDLGIPTERWKEAHESALVEQKEFELQCLKIGSRALDFCRERDLPPVVVLGRPYTIYNTVLNSNIPALLREQGAIGIPVDCYPTRTEIPIFDSVYWSYAQRILRAAHEIRRTPGVYSLYCSNYSCGPDSFNLHFYTYGMEGHPFAIIETDGHAGDAGTKTRVEAFLYCVEEDRRRSKTQTPARDRAAPNDFSTIRTGEIRFKELIQSGEKLLVPWMGRGSEALAASFRAMGLPCENLPIPDSVALRAGRRETSGKECLPMALTLGNLITRMERERDSGQRFVLLMPRSHGPCRFGVYTLLNQITLERLGLKNRVRTWSPSDSNYFKDFPSGFRILTSAGIIASDMLKNALFDVRPVETESGAAQNIYERFQQELVSLLEKTDLIHIPTASSLWQVMGGELFGIRDLLKRAALSFASVRGNVELPTVAVVGEIYVRSDPFANDFVIEKLEKRGLRARLAPVGDWLEYCDYVGNILESTRLINWNIPGRILMRLQEICHRTMGEPLHWPDRTPVRTVLRAAGPYLRDALHGEAIMTLGGPLHEWGEGHLDGVVSTGPLECMPNKIAEAQFFHITEKENLPSLTLAYNGDPIDSAPLDNFASEVRARFLKRKLPQKHRVLHSPFQEVISTPPPLPSQVQS